MNNNEVIDKAQKELNKKLNLVLRGAAITTFNSIIKQSPVDTGRFRGNWQATINTPASGTIGVVGVKTSDVDHPEQKLSGSELKDSLYLTNNLPYAEPLENGHSQQRPAGWVRTTVLSAQSELDKKFKEIVE